MLIYLNILFNVICLQCIKVMRRSDFPNLFAHNFSFPTIYSYGVVELFSILALGTDLERCLCYESLYRQF